MDAKSDSPPPFLKSLHTNQTYGSHSTLFNDTPINHNRQSNQTTLNIPINLLSKLSQITPSKPSPNKFSARPLPKNTLSIQAILDQLQKAARHINQSTDL